MRNAVGLHDIDNVSNRADELRDLFSQYGSISDVYVPMDYFTREPRGFAYVQYPCLLYIGMG